MKNVKVALFVLLACVLATPVIAGNVFTAPEYTWVVNDPQGDTDPVTGRTYLDVKSVSMGDDGLYYYFKLELYGNKSNYWYDTYYIYINSKIGGSKYWIFGNSIQGADFFIRVFGDTPEGTLPRYSMFGYINGWANPWAPLGHPYLPSEPLIDYQFSGNTLEFRVEKDDSTYFNPISDFIDALRELFGDGRPFAFGAGADYDRGVQHFHDQTNW